MLVAKTKMLFNSIISTKGAHFMTVDISNFYLMTSLHQPEFIRMKLSDIPDKVIVKYKLRENATPEGSIYIKAKRGMYVLPQSGLVANKFLEKRLNKHRYRQSKLVPGLWKQTQSQYHSHWLSKTLEWNMLVRNMPIISNRLWKKITNSFVIGRDHNTLALH